MAEYYPLLARAISAQPNASREVRVGIYDRARKALLGQLRAHDPPIPDGDIDRESQALEEAIARLEAEQADAPPTANGSTQDSFTQAKPSPRDIRAVSVADRAKAHRANLEAARFQRPDGEVRAEKATGAPVPGSEKSGRVAPAPLLVADNGAGVESSSLLGPELKADADFQRAIPKSGLLWKFGRSRADQTQREALSDADDIAGDDERRRAEALGGSAPAIENPRVESSRPRAPTVRERERSPLLYWGLGALAALVASGVGLAAFLMRDAPQTVDSAKNSMVAENKQPTKIVERIGAGARLGAPDRRPGSLGDQSAMKSPDAASAPAAPAPPASVSAPASAAQDAAPVATPSAPTAPAQQSAIPVAQRAALLVQAPTSSDPQAIATYVGSVIWRLETITPTAGRQPELAVRAEIDIPDAKLKISALLAKNEDDSLPASHTIELKFMPGSGSVIGNVRQIDTPQMRKEESPAGDPLAGIPTPITANYFLVGLAKGDPAQSRNMDLIRTAGWFDVPMLLASGRIAKVTFEKGVSGQKDLNDALASWAN